jgi:hypothetical protein
MTILNYLCFGVLLQNANTCRKLNGRKKQRSALPKYGVNEKD